METVLEVRRLKKNIKKSCIIHETSFYVNRGEIFGFLGPNGAGKTTIIRMIVNLVRPTQGEILVCGYNVNQQPEEALKHVGCIVENPNLYPYLTGQENIEYFARMTPSVSKDRIAEIIERVQLTNRIHEKVKTYSLGMKQRLGIAIALLGNPKILILDEPTNGLDPFGIQDLRHFLMELSKEGMAVFISSHFLSEIEMICDRLAFLHQGKLVYQGATKDLLEQQERYLALGVDDEKQTKEILKEKFEAEVLQGISMLHVHQILPEHVGDLSRTLIEKGIQIHHLSWQQPNLEQIFMTLIGERSIC